MVNLDNIKSKEGIDLSEFNMMDTEIEVIEIKDYQHEEEQDRVNVPDLELDEERAKKEKLRLIVQTKILKDGTKIRGTLFFNLFRDREVTEGCNIVFSKSENAFLPKFLDFFKLDKDSLAGLKDLKGKPCKTIIKKDNNNRDKVEIYYAN